MPGTMHYLYGRCFSFTEIYSLTLDTPVNVSEEIVVKDDIRQVIETFICSNGDVSVVIIHNNMVRYEIVCLRLLVYFSMEWNIH